MHMAAPETPALFSANDTSEDIRPVVMDFVFASSATCTISHSVPSITLPETDKQRLEKMNESIGKTKIFLGFHCTTGHGAAHSIRALRG